MAVRAASGAMLLTLMTAFATSSGEEAAHGAPLFQDDFNRRDLDGWQVKSGTWRIQRDWAWRRT